MVDIAQHQWESREFQRFPVLNMAEIARLRPFGSELSHVHGDILVRNGETGVGLSIILSGAVEVSWQDVSGASGHIITHGAGTFMGELAQLSGQPSLVEAKAIGNVEAIYFTPGQLRTVLGAEADLGERIMRALILRRIALIETGTGGPVILGRREDASVLKIGAFLFRSGHPYLQLDPTLEVAGKALATQFGIAEGQFPAVICPGGEILFSPSERLLAQRIGLASSIDTTEVYDVAIVGGGPAGIATAVYAASEGLRVIVLDRRSFGGQAGASARIENFLGFPTGISGAALMARARTQAQKFGADMAAANEVLGLECASVATAHHTLLLCGGKRLRAKSIVIATGARYRRLGDPDIYRYEGSSVHYWASPLEAKLSRGQNIALVGGGNSAGQAVAYLAEHAEHVTLLARKNLRHTMSRYLIDRIQNLHNVHIVEEVEVSALEGDSASLSRVRWRSVASAAEGSVAASQLFLFIGADPNTDWLQATGVAVDDSGFVLTGKDVEPGRGALETSRNGVFAVGDVRSGSVKRVAASAGDGAHVVSLLHSYLARVLPSIG